ncbi:MAG: hypothetical protein ACU84H_12915 [Gammaproteobacteria bacterium]
MIDKYQPFIAQAKTKHGSGQQVFPTETELGTVMTIRTSDGDIYISRRDAIRFFGLTNPNDYLSRI